MIICTKPTKIDTFVTAIRCFQIFVYRSDSCHSERSAAKSKNPFSSSKVWGNGSFGALRLLRMTQNPMDFVCGGGQPAPYSNYCNSTINTNLGLYFTGYRNIINKSQVFRKRCTKAWFIGFISIGNTLFCG